MDGFVRNLRALQAAAFDHDVLLPEYDRGIHNPVADAKCVRADVDVVQVQVVWRRSANCMFHVSCCCVPSLLPVLDTLWSPGGGASFSITL